MRVGLAIAVVVLLGSAVPAAQHGYTRAQIENGARMFQASCATCHGAAGDTVRGTSLLRGEFRRATSDEELVRIIIEGIPGTAMPPGSYSELEAGMIVAYLRGMAAGDAIDGVLGNVDAGEAIFRGKGACTTCHTPRAALAPSLADVGALRRPLDIERSILEPGAELHADYRFVRAVTNEGEEVSGRLLNQSTFSVQILDRDGRLRGFDRADLREYAVQSTSPMPSYRERLEAQEVADLVAYLTSLRGTR